jgi:squalene cyclase
VGFHQHDLEAELQDEPEDALALRPLVAESEFEFFSRRALEEARLAQLATTPAAANAHRYLAAAYSEQLAKHIKVHSELEELLSTLP